MGVLLGRRGGGQMDRCRGAGAGLVASAVRTAKHASGHVVEQQLLLSIELLSELLGAVRLLAAWQVAAAAAAVRLTLAMQTVLVRVQAMRQAMLLAAGLRLMVRVQNGRLLMYTVTVSVQCRVQRRRSVRRRTVSQLIGSGGLLTAHRGQVAQRRVPGRAGRRSGPVLIVEHSVTIEHVGGHRLVRVQTVHRLVLNGRTQMVRSARLQRCVHLMVHTVRH